MTHHNSSVTPPPQKIGKSLVPHFSGQNTASYLQELESVSGWLMFSSALAAAAAASPSTPPRAAEVSSLSTPSCSTGASPEGSMLDTGRERRRGGGEAHAAGELPHSGWLAEREQEFPVAPAPPEPLRLPDESTNFLL